MRWMGLVLRRWPKAVSVWFSGGKPLASAQRGRLMGCDGRPPCVPARGFLFTSDGLVRRQSGGGALAAQRYDGGGARRTPVARGGGGRWFAGFGSRSPPTGAQKIKCQITITLHISNFVIVTRLLNNHLVTKYGSGKFGAIAHVGIFPFTIIRALIAVYHSSK